MIDLNSKALHPTEKDENDTPLPYLYDYTMAVWLAEYLESRITTDQPVLEARVATELRANGSFAATAEELEYIRNTVIKAPVDNLFKGQVLALLVL